MSLTPSQRETLAAWWTVNRKLGGRSWNDRVLHLPKGQLDALHRQGLVTRPPYGLPSVELVRRTDG